MIKRRKPYTKIEVDIIDTGLLEISTDAALDLIDIETAMEADEAAADANEITQD